MYFKLTKFCKFIVMYRPICDEKRCFILSNKRGKFFCIVVIVLLMIVAAIIIKVEVIELLDTGEYDYPIFHLSMDCFICNIKSGDLVLKEHEAAQWLTKETLDSVNWLPADLGLIDKIREYLQCNR